MGIPTPGWFRSTSIRLVPLTMSRESTISFLVCSILCGVYETLNPADRSVTPTTPSADFMEGGPDVRWGGRGYVWPDIPTSSCHTGLRQRSSR